MIRLTRLAFTEWPTAWSVVHLLLWVGSGMTGLVFIGGRIVLKENLLWDSQRLISGASPERRILSARFPGTQGPNAPWYNLSISSVCPQLWYRLTSLRGQRGKSPVCSVLFPCLLTTKQSPGLAGTCHGAGSTQTAYNCRVLQGWFFWFFFFFF